MKMKCSLLAVVIGAGALFAGAGVEADRFGALYYLGETAAFATDQTGAWRVTDWRETACASGEVADGAIAVSHEALGKRFGAFKLTVGTNETWFAFLRSKSVKPCDWVGVGTHCHHGWYGQDYHYLDLMSAAGIGVVRDDVIWDWYEKKKGEYVFDAKLRGLIEELNKRGIRFHPVLNGQNALYENPLDPDAYAKFAAAFVKAFRGKVDSCDIFNEPHNFAFPKVYLPKGGKFRDWQCRPDAPWIPRHAEVTRKAVDAIKAVDPAFSVGVGVEDYWDFFKTMMRGDLIRQDDLVSIHPYDHEHYPPEGNWLFRDNGREVREYVKAHGGATRFAITECGWTTYDAKRDATHAFVGGYPPCTLVQQAQYLIRFWILSRQLGIEFACQYDFRDDGPRRNYTEDNFGLVREDYTPKPSFTAVATMTRLLGDAEPLGSKSANESQYRFYVFRRGDRLVTVAWTLKGEEVVDAPAGFPVANARCLDLQGNEIPVATRDGKYVLSEVPVYLVHAASSVRLGTPFSSGAVLQRGRKVRVWGTAKLGEAVTVSFGGKNAAAAANAQGRWTAEIGPFGADKEGRTLWANDAAATDVVVGEVWMCSGQSNADCPIWGNDPHYRDGNGAMMRQTTVKPFVRLVKVDNVASADPRSGFSAKWVKMTPDAQAKARPCSAMGFYYALELANALDVPVGLVDASWGGTNIDAWTPKSGYESVPELKDVADWQPVREQKDWKPENKKAPIWDWIQQPSFLYNGMVAAFAPMTMRGFIWYQGCHNAYEPECRRYSAKMHALYNGWKKEFANPDLKLYFVQLAPYKGLSGYAPLCLQQAQFAAEEPNAEMTVINDLGNLEDIHPNNKQPVAKRLAAHALRNDYGFTAVECESPVLKSSRVENGKFVLAFDHGTGWYLYSPDWKTDCGFEVCGEDGQWRPAVLENIEWLTSAKGEKYTRGRVKGAELVVASAEVPAPKGLRYLCGKPRAGILYNQVCLPLGAFEVK